MNRKPKCKLKISPKGKLISTKAEEVISPKKNKKSKDSIDKELQRIDDYIKVRNQIKTVKLESLIDQKPEVIMNFLIDQLRGVEHFEATRVNFPTKNPKVYDKLSIMQNLKTLKLRECKITDDQIDIIITKLKNSKLENLDVSFNSIREPKNLKLLFNEYDCLRSLHLNRNQLTIGQVKDILVYAQYSQSMKVLDLSSNGYAFDHCQGCCERELFKLLKINFRLEELYLIDAAFEFRDVDKIYDFMNRIFDSNY